MINHLVEVSTPAQLEYIDQNQSAYLNADIALTANIALPNPSGRATANWMPFGSMTDRFMGEFNGDGHTITNLLIGSTGLNNVGFFGVIYGGAVQNLILQGTINTTAVNNENTGILAGQIDAAASITDVLVSGSITVSGSIGASADGYAGGLVGWALGSTIESSMSTASVTVSSDDGAEGVGGLLGYSSGNTLANVAATGSTTAYAKFSALGGLLGSSGGDTLTNGYASGTIHSANAPDASPGGLISATYSYAPDTITHSYFDTTTTQETEASPNGALNGVTAESNSAMQDASTYTGWNFSTVWNMQAGVNDGLPVITMPSVPTAPSLTSATPANQQLAIAWTTAGNGGSPITGYQITATPTGGPSVTSTVPASSTDATISGLSNGVAYTVTVQATNAMGISDISNSLTATPVTTETIPNAPLHLQGRPENGAVALTWMPPTNSGGTALTTSVVYATYGTSANASSFTQSVPADVHTAIVPNLTNGTPYTFHVNATNALGASPASNMITVTPAAVPSAPLNLTGIAGHGQVTLQWTLPPNPSGTSLTTTAVYAVYGQAGSFVQTFGPTTTSATIQPLTNGVAYTFTVNTANGVGASVYSNTVTLTPVAPNTPTPSSYQPAPPIPLTPRVQILPTGITVPAGLTTTATFGFANRNAATIHFPVSVTQPLTISIKRWPGVPIGLSNYRDLFGIIGVTVQVSQDPTATVLPLPVADTILDIADHPLPVGTLIMEWNPTAHRWMHIATVTQRDTTTMALPIPTQTSVLYAFARPQA